MRRSLIGAITISPATRITTLSAIVVSDADENRFFYCVAKAPSDQYRENGNDRKMSRDCSRERYRLTSFQLLYRTQTPKFARMVPSSHQHSRQSSQMTTLCVDCLFLSRDALHTSAVYAITFCLSVCPSVCLSTVTSAEGRSLRLRFCNGLYVCVCLCVCVHKSKTKSYERILIIFFGGVRSNDQSIRSGPWFLTFELFN